MACISSNRVYARVLQDKLYQLFVNNKSTIYQQSRNHFNATGSIYISSNRKQQFNGFNSLARNLSGSQKVNNFKDRKKKLNHNAIITDKCHFNKKEKTFHLPPNFSIDYYAIRVCYYIIVFERRTNKIKCVTENSDGKSQIEK